MLFKGAVNTVHVPGPQKGVHGSPEGSMFCPLPICLVSNQLTLLN